MLPKNRVTIRQLEARRYICRFAWRHSDPDLRQAVRRSRSPAAPVHFAAPASGGRMRDENVSRFDGARRLNAHVG